MPVVINQLTFLFTPHNEFNGPQVQVSTIIWLQGKIIVYYEIQAGVVEDS